MLVEEDTDGRPPWLVTSLKKRNFQQAAIAPFRTIEYPLNADDITGINDIAELGKEIEGGRFKAHDVTLAYVRR